MTTDMRTEDLEAIRLVLAANAKRAFDFMNMAGAWCGAADQAPQVAVNEAKYIRACGDFAEAQRLLDLLR